MQVNAVERLDANQTSAVLALAGAATRADGVAPLSEQAVLSLRGADPGSLHLLAYAGTHLAGYAHLERGVAGDVGPAATAATAEIVVDPADRRSGVGTALIRYLEETVAGQHDSATLQVWSHGHLEAARAMAIREGYTVVRELWSMRRSLLPEAGPLPAVHLPAGFTARPFVVGQDEDTWLRVNARAFVNHPEQGRMTRLDLDRRIAETWFDATGFILIEDGGGTAGPTPVLAASHWTKVVPADPEAPDADTAALSANTKAPGADTEAPDAMVIPSDAVVTPTEGEVYVVGVDPAYQGMGLGRAVTVLGLAHLLERGLATAVLYVDADNAAAVKTYARLGFTRSAVDAMYSRVIHP